MSTFTVNSDTGVTATVITASAQTFSTTPATSSTYSVAGGLFGPAGPTGPQGTPGVIQTLAAADATVVVAGTAANPTVKVGAVPEASVTNLVSDLAAKATDTAVVHNTGAETIGGAKTFSATPILSAVKPAADAITGVQIQNAAGTSVVNVDTTNARVGIGNSAPGAKLDIGGTTDATSIFKALWRGDATNSKYGVEMSGSGASAFTGDGALFFAHLDNASDSGKTFVINHSGTNLISTVMQINKYGTGTGSGLQIANLGTGAGLTINNQSTGAAINVTQTTTGYGATIAGNVGIATTTPTSLLQVVGAIATAFSAKTGAYTLTQTDSVISVDATTAAFIVTLPDATTSTGRQYTIKKVDSSVNNVTLATTSSQTVDGATTKVISGQYTSVIVVSNGANWLIANSSFTRSVSNISANTTAGTAANTDYVYFVTGTTTLTLPTAVGNANRYVIKNTDASLTTTVATTSSQTIDGSTTAPLTPNTSLEVISNGTNWQVI